MKRPAEAREPSSDRDANDFEYTYPDPAEDDIFVPMVARPMARRRVQALHTMLDLLLTSADQSLIDEITDKLMVYAAAWASVIVDINS